MFLSSDSVHNWFYSMYLSHMKFRRKQRHFLLYPSFHFTVFASTKHKNWNTIPKCSLYVDLKTWAILASSNLKNTISIDLVNDLLDFRYVLKKCPWHYWECPWQFLRNPKVPVTSARDICARDIFKMPVTIFEKVPVTSKNCPWQKWKIKCHGHFLMSREKKTLYYNTLFFTDENAD